MPAVKSGQGHSTGSPKYRSARRPLLRSNGLRAMARQSSSRPIQLYAPNLPADVSKDGAIVVPQDARSFETFWIDDRVARDEPTAPRRSQNPSVPVETD
jgi:hypothetical protein